MAMDVTITEEDFIKFSSEIIPYIEKEKTTEELIEKFIERFMLYSQEAELRRENLTSRENRGVEEIMEFNPIRIYIFINIYMRPHGRKRV
jgi:transcription antitermination factor NusG